MENNKVGFRQLEPGDIPACLSLCRSAGWNQTENEWDIFLKLSAGGCLCAIDVSGNVIGTVTSVRYQDRFCWIGMVLVDPHRQRQGIGLHLLEEILKLLDKEVTIRLDATPTGREVYLRLGFEDEYELRRLQCHHRIKMDILPSEEATHMTQNDLLAIIDFDRSVFGADRQFLLQEIFNHDLQHAFIIRNNKEIIGYCLGRTGHDFTHIGPVVAQNESIAARLVASLLQNTEEKPVIIDVLGKGTSWIDKLSTLGFEYQRPFIRMFKGRNIYPGKPEQQFAILGPEFG